MEATLLSSRFFPSKLRGSDTQIYSLPLVRTKTNCVSFKTNPIRLSTRNSILLNRNIVSTLSTRVSAKSSNQFRNEYTDVEATAVDSLDLGVAPVGPNEGADVVRVEESEGSGGVEAKPVMFKNRFLDLVRISSVINNAAEAFFKSEIRRRLCVRAALIVISRVGYFIPLPGFDRRLIPQDYLSLGSVDELGDFTAELKMSLFQLGISPQIIASIIMQVLCYLVPSLVKMRKEGLDGQEKIKSYMCV